MTETEIMAAMLAVGEQGIEKVEVDFSGSLYSTTLRLQPTCHYLSGAHYTNQNSANK